MQAPLTVSGGEVDPVLIEAGKKRSARKPCKKGQVRGPKSKGSRCHKRRRPSHKKSHKKSRKLRGGETVPQVDPVLTAGALEDAFQAGLEAGRMHRRRSHRRHVRGGEEVPVVQGGNQGQGQGRHGMGMYGGEDSLAGGSVLGGLIPDVTGGRRMCGM